MPDEEKTLFEFHGEAQDYYTNLNDPEELANLSEVLLSIAENPEIDFENIFEYPVEAELRKICLSINFLDCILELTRWNH